MKHYVSSFKVGVGGMAVAGPFDTRAEADSWVTNLTIDQRNLFPCLQLTMGPDDLGPEWASNLNKFINV